MKNRLFYWLIFFFMPQSISAKIFFPAHFEQTESKEVVLVFDVDDVLVNRQFSLEKWKKFLAIFN